MIYKLFVPFPKFLWLFYLLGFLLYIIYTLYNVKQFCKLYNAIFNNTFSTIIIIFVLDISR